eukprot:6490738-Amphidinium_carterae.1
MRGTAAVWDLAILHKNGYALSPDQTAQAEHCQEYPLATGTSNLSQRAYLSSWLTGDLSNIIAHCPLGKARGVDKWSIGELRLLPDVAIEDLVHW